MPRTILKRFRLRGFRSCKDASIGIANDITALIGPNGSGKTNLLQGLTLLKGSARRSTYRENEKDSSASRCQVEADFQFGRRKIFYRASIVFRHNDRYGREDVLDLEEKWNFRELKWKNEWIYSPWLSVFSERSPYRGIHFTPDSYKYWQPKFAKRATKDIPKRIVSVVEAIKNLCSGISYYSASQFTNPALCPTSFEIDEDGDLLSTTRNSDHSRFLYDLFDLQQSDPKQYSSFLSLVGKKGLRLIDRVAFKSIKFSSYNYEVRSGGRLVNKRSERKLIVPTVHIGSSRLSFDQLSEGTFRTLALLFYVTTDKSTLLLLEEPEVCVHHGLLNSVIEVIKEFSGSKQIIFSTHAESVVDKLQPDQIRLVDNTPRKGTTVKVISRALSARGYEALKEYLNTTGSLGEYWKSAGFGE